METPDAAPVVPTPASRPFALVGYVDSPAEIYRACEVLRDAGYRHFDAHTPFPVHGLERAMGLRPSVVPWIVLVCGIVGASSGLLMQWWTLAVDYPVNISGKPFFAYQAYLPVTFELMVLLSAFGCFFGMWGLNLLPTFFHPVMQHPSFHRASDDKFFISVEARDRRFDMERTRQLLLELGVKELTEVQP